MVGPEIRDTANIAVSAMILAGLLSFIAFVLTLAYSLSGAHNDEVYAKESLASYHQFSNFDGSQKLNGLDVISAIRDYSDTHIEILVKSAGVSKLYNKTNATLDKNSITVQALECQFYAPNNADAGCKAGSMNTVYNAVLLYGHTDILTINERTYAKPSVFDTGVTGIIFYEVSP